MGLPIGGKKRKRRGGAQAHRALVQPDSTGAFRESPSGAEFPNV